MPLMVGNHRQWVGELAIWLDFCPILAQFRPIWSRFGSIWSDLCAIWSDLARYGAIWRDMVRFGAIWSDFLILGMYPSNCELAAPPAMGAKPYQKQPGINGILPYVRWDMIQSLNRLHMGATDTLIPGN